MTKTHDPDRNFYRAIYALVAFAAIYFAAHLVAFAFAPSPATVAPVAPCETDAECVAECVREGYSFATCSDQMRTGRPLGSVLEEEGETE